MTPLGFEFDQAKFQTLDEMWTCSDEQCTIVHLCLILSSTSAPQRWKTLELTLALSIIHLIVTVEYQKKKLDSFI